MLDEYLMLRGRLWVGQRYCNMSHSGCWGFVFQGVYLKLNHVACVQNSYSVNWSQYVICFLRVSDVCVSAVPWWAGLHADTCCIMIHKF